MKYLLDSNIISDFYDKFSTGYALISHKLATLSNLDVVCISILTMYELEYGCANAPAEKKAIIRQKIIEAQQDFKVVALSPKGAQIFGKLKKTLKETRMLSPEHLKKHNIDLMLASTAITEQCILVSADAIYTELLRYHAALQIENWLA